MEKNVKESRNEEVPPNGLVIARAYSGRYSLQEAVNQLTKKNNNSSTTPSKKISKKNAIT